MSRTVPRPLPVVEMPRPLPVVEKPRPLPVVEKPRPLPVVEKTEKPEAGEWSAEGWASSELRKSNEVDGFTYSRLKGWLYVLKMVLAIPLVPLWPFFIAMEAKDSSLVRNYFKTMRYCLKSIHLQVQKGSFLRMLKYNLLFSPQEVQQRILERRGGCSRCAKCCRELNCIFLGKDEETQDHYCKVYKTTYWYYGTCGRYPLDQRDIDDHACPGFSFPTQEAA